MSEQSITQQVEQVGFWEKTEQKRSQIILFDKYEHNNKFNNGYIKIKTNDLKFDDCFTFGIQVNKFDSSKYLLTLCITKEYIEMFKCIEEECCRNFREQKLNIDWFRNGLYENKLLVKVYPEFTSIYKDGEEVDFEDMLQEKNFRVDAEVDVKGVFVNSIQVAYLQLRLRKLIVLKKRYL